MAADSKLVRIFRRLARGACGAALAATAACSPSGQEAEATAAALGGSTSTDSCALVTEAELVSFGVARTPAASIRPMINGQPRDRCFWEGKGGTPGLSLQVSTLERENQLPDYQVTLDTQMGGRTEVEPGVSYHESMAMVSVRVIKGRRMITLLYNANDVGKFRDPLVNVGRRIRRTLEP